jgi:predicted nucleotidyltransferase component of viral defense system
MDFDSEIRLTDSQALHTVVMRAVAEQLQDTPYVLKGGSALILTRSLNRYSTDLDFDSQIKLNLAGRIESALKNIREIELRSLKVVKDTDTVQRYKIHYINKQTGEDTLLKIETSFRDIPQLETIETIAGIKTYSIKALFDQKLDAATNRAEARDLYDLAFLVKHFGSQLREEQIEAVQGFTENPDQLVEQYQATFQIDEALANLTTLEDIALSIHLDVEALYKQRNLEVQHLDSQSRRVPALQQGSSQNELNLRAAKSCAWLVEKFGEFQPDGSKVWAVGNYTISLKAKYLQVSCNERQRPILECKDDRINGSVTLGDLRRFEGTEQAAKAEIQRLNHERKRGRGRSR